MTVGAEKGTEQSMRGISCRFCRQVEALLPAMFSNFQQPLKLEKKYLESSEF
jgi:hypothetical protein